VTLRSYVTQSWDTLKYGSPGTAVQHNLQVAHIGTATFVV